MNKFVEAIYSPRGQVINQVIALVPMVIFVTALVINVGVPPMIIVAGSATIGFFCGRETNLRQAITSVKTAIIFLLTTAGLHAHLMEEHGCLFAPAMSRLFNTAFSDERFLMFSEAFYDSKAAPNHCF